MHFMRLNRLSDFMQVLYSKRKHPTKKEDFPMYILFTRIYLLQEQKLNSNKYSEQELNMGNFVQPTENNVHIYEKARDFTFYVFL
jgi:hypothetical protein